MDAWGILILLAGVGLIMLGITGKAENVLNGARVKSGSPTKAPVT